jgi:hypothetical protein
MYRLSNVVTVSDTDDDDNNNNNNNIQIIDKIMYKAVYLNFYFQIGVYFCAHFTELRCLNVVHISSNWHFL